MQLLMEAIFVKFTGLLTGREFLFSDNSCLYITHLAMQHLELFCCRILVIQFLHVVNLIYFTAEEQFKTEATYDVMAR
jgi:hypothetical protein